MKPLQYNEYFINTVDTGNFNQNSNVFIQENAFENVM